MSTIALTDTAAELVFAGADGEPHFPVSSAVGLSAAPSTPRCVAADSPAVPTPHPGTAGQPACHHVMCAQVYGGARCLDPVGVCIDFRDGHQTHPE